MSEYIRSYRGGIPHKGWAVVNVPGEKPLEVVEPLATEIANLVARGKVREAQTLIFWFDSDSVSQQREEVETGFVETVKETVEARSGRLRAIAEQASLAVEDANTAVHFARHAAQHNGSIEGLKHALALAARRVANARALLAIIEEGER